MSKCSAPVRLARCFDVVVPWYIATPSCSALLYRTAESTPPASAIELTSGVTTSLITIVDVCADSTVMSGRQWCITPPSTYVGRANVVGRTVSVHPHSELSRSISTAPRFSNPMYSLGAQNARLSLVDLCVPIITSAERNALVNACGCNIDVKNRQPICQLMLCRREWSVSNTFTLLPSANAYRAAQYAAMSLPSITTSVGGTPVTPPIMMPFPSPDVNSSSLATPMATCPSNSPRQRVNVGSVVTPRSALSVSGSLISSIAINVTPFDAIILNDPTPRVFRPTMHATVCPSRISETSASVGGLTLTTMSALIASLWLSVISAPTLAYCSSLKRDNLPASRSYITLCP